MSHTLQPRSLCSECGAVSSDLVTFPCGHPICLTCRTGPPFSDERDVPRTRCIHRLVESGTDAPLSNLEVVENLRRSISRLPHIGHPDFIDAVQKDVVLHHAFAVYQAQFINRFFPASEDSTAHMVVALLAGLFREGKDGELEAVPPINDCQCNARIQRSEDLNALVPHQSLLGFRHSRQRDRSIAAQNHGPKSRAQERPSQSEHYSDTHPCGSVPSIPLSRSQGVFEARLDCVESSVEGRPSSKVASKSRARRPSVIKPHYSSFETPQPSFSIDTPPTSLSSPSSLPLRSTSNSTDSRGSMEGHSVLEVRHFHAQAVARYRHEMAGPDSDRIQRIWTALNGPTRINPLIELVKSLDVPDHTIIPTAAQRAFEKLRDDITELFVQFNKAVAGGPSPHYHPHQTQFNDIPAAARQERGRDGSHASHLPSSVDSQRTRRSRSRLAPSLAYEPAASPDEDPAYCAPAPLRASEILNLREEYPPSHQGILQHSYHPTVTAFPWLPAQVSNTAQDGPYGHRSSPKTKLIRPAKVGVTARTPVQSHEVPNSEFDILTQPFSPPKTGSNKDQRVIGGNKHDRPRLEGLGSPPNRSIGTSYTPARSSRLPRRRSQSNAVDTDAPIVPFGYGSGEEADSAWDRP